MPATRIETGVLLELKRLVPTPHARKHNPEKIASLAQSLKDHNQQLEDLIVCPQEEDNREASSVAREASQTGDTLHEQRFTVLAGVGRKQAEESLGWTKARCTILYGLTPYEKLKVTLDENKEREEEGPLDEARLYRAMKEAEPDLSQEALAKRLGMEQGTLSQYLSLTKLDSKVQEVIDRSINLGFAHLLQICRLNTPEDATQASDRCVSDQITLAREADQNELSVKELKSLVNKRLLKKAPVNKYEEKTKVVSGTEETGSIQDPLKSIWSDLETNPDNYPSGLWDVAYGSFKIGKETEKGWILRFTEGMNPPAELAEWFRKAAEALIRLDQAQRKQDAPKSQAVRQAIDAFQTAFEQTDTKEIKSPTDWMAKILPAYLKAASQAPAQPASSKASASTSPGLDLAVKNGIPEESPQVRLPQSEAEQSELESLAPQGPQTVFAWIHGPDSEQAKEAAGKTWQEYGVADPVASVRDIVGFLRDAQEVQAMLKK